MMRDEKFKLSKGVLLKLERIRKGSLKSKDQWGQIVLEDGPEDVKIDLVITMDQAIAKAGNLHPGHILEQTARALGCS